MGGRVEGRMDGGLGVWGYGRGGVAVMGGWMEGWKNGKSGEKVDVQRAGREQGSAAGDEKRATRNAKRENT